MKKVHLLSLAVILSLGTMNAFDLYIHNSLENPISAEYTYTGQQLQTQPLLPGQRSVGIPNIDQLEQLSIEGAPKEETHFMGRPGQSTIMMAKDQVALHDAKQVAADKKRDVMITVKMSPRSSEAEFQVKPI